MNQEQLAAIEEGVGAGTGDVPIEGDVFWEAQDVRDLLESHQLLQKIVGELVLIALECEGDDLTQDRAVADAARIAWVQTKLGLEDMDQMTRGEVWKKITGKDLGTTKLAGNITDAAKAYDRDRPKTMVDVLDEAKNRLLGGVREDQAAAGMEYNEEQDLPDHAPPCKPQAGQPDSPESVSPAVRDTVLDVDVTVIADTLGNEHGQPEAVVCILQSSRVKDIKKLRRAIIAADTIQLVITQDRGITP
jgi:hypothetical protein